ncbi:MAG: hypothetical protein ABIE55_01085 [Candidatus Aenigmatarchaeota archaeon]
MSDYCPICQKRFKDILKHFSYYHEIGDMEQLKKEVKLAESEEKRREAYGKFIKEINQKLEKKEIDIKEWRRLREVWERKNPKT